MKKFTITIPEDVAKFFFYLVFDRRVNFHPDDDFNDYVPYERKLADERTFTSEEADYYNSVMQKCFEVCKKYDRDIYLIASDIFRCFNYCDKGVEMP